MKNPWAVLDGESWMPGQIFFATSTSKTALKRWKRVLLPMVPSWLPATVFTAISDTISSILAQTEESISFFKACLVAHEDVQPLLSHLPRTLISCPLAFLSPYFVFCILNFSSGSNIFCTKVITHLLRPATLLKNRLANAFCCPLPIAPTDNSHGILQIHWVTGG